MSQPNKQETEFLLEAQRDFIKTGKTDKDCPRCGNQLVYEAGTSWEMTYCKKQDCIGVAAKGI